TVRGTLANGTVASVSGTVTGPRLTEKIVEIDGFDIDVALTSHLLFFKYQDRPGIVGIVGGILGQAGVNIAGMQVSRNTEGGEALVALTVAPAVPPAVVAEITTTIGATSGRAVDLEV